MGMRSLDGSGYVPEGQPITMENVLGLSDIKVDYQWFEHYDIEFLAGRPFRRGPQRRDAHRDVLWAVSRAIYGRAVEIDRAAGRLQEPTRH